MVSIVVNFLYEFKNNILKVPKGYLLVIDHVVIYELDDYITTDLSALANT